ncbi:GL17422 [Drosophila persimilis]|uniref:GL17422 n=1 Tax=Drosophila persimilis TaxID=7234 RepID=B4GGX1_DROPE|nr:GL17422 [Drosophila persimilis]
MRTIQRDCMVLESFQIMDYSLLVGIHNLDIAAKEKREERIRNARAKLQRKESAAQTASSNVHLDDDAPEADQNQLHAVASYASIPGTSGAALNRTRSMNRQRLVAHSTAMESITADMDVTLEEDEDVPAGGIPARSENDERLILYIGIIDILQSGQRTPKAATEADADVDGELEATRSRLCDQLDSLKLDDDAEEEKHTATESSTPPRPAIRRRRRLARKPKPEPEEPSASEDEDVKDPLPPYNNETVYLGEAPPPYNNETVTFGGSGDPEETLLPGLLSPLRVHPSESFTASTSTPKTRTDTRFQDAMAKQVFKKTPTFPLKHSPSKRKTSASQLLRTPQTRTPAQSTPAGGSGRPGVLTMMSGMSTPPPAFDDISEEDITAASSTTLQNRSQTNNNHGEEHQPELGRVSGGSGGGGGGEPSSTYHTQYSYDSSGRTGSAMTSDYSDDESTVSRSRSPLQQQRTSHRLTKTSVQVTTVGYVEERQLSNAGGQVVHADTNGKVGTMTTSTTTKTALIQAPSYTSTLVLNDLPH